VNIFLPDKVTRNRRWKAAGLSLMLLTSSAAWSRDLADSEYAELLARIYGGHPTAANALLDSLAGECAGEPFFLIAQARLRLEAIPEDDLDKARAKKLSQPVLETLQQVIDICTQRLDAGGDELELRRLRGWAWMVRSQAHAQGGSFYSAGREAGRGKSDLDFYLAAYPDDPVANGLLGAFLYFTDAVPAIFQMLSKLMFMPTGDRARGLQMITLAENGPSAKVEDFRTLAMTVNVLFEGRWEAGLPQAMRLQAEQPAYVRLALPLSAMRLLAPGLGADLATHIDVTEMVSAGLPAAEVDTASLWMSRTYRAWIDRLLLGPAAAEVGFKAIVAAAPADPDWVAAFAERQLEELAADRADGLPDAWAAQVWNAPLEALSELVASLGETFASSLRAEFWAAECHLRMGELDAAESLYRKVAENNGPEHLEPFRLVACARVGEIKARAGSYRAASRWYERALDHHRDVYRVDWMLKGRARHFDELSRDGGQLADEPVLFATP
jgi:tetratricopeptide (TPR) repeat protein